MPNQTDTQQKKDESPHGTFNNDTTSSGRPRTSCICGRAVVRQYWMNNQQWESAKKNFMKEHQAIRP